MSPISIIKNITVASILFVSMTGCIGNSQEITIVNDSDQDRNEEIVSVNANSISVSNPGKLRIIDNTGTEIPYQHTFDNKVIFPVSVKAHTKVVYSVKPGIPSAADTIVWGRQFPERKDDMAWENDRCAYRAYGPALQQSGEKAFGYDIWTKSVSHRVLEKRFDLDINQGVSFHVDHGEGMDVYAVGPTLGGGTAALLDSIGEIVYPYCYESYEILDNGPIRFTVQLNYAPIKVGKDSMVTEQRVISLDKGSWLNKTSVRYTGLSTTSKIAPGIVVHKQNPDGYILGKKHMAYADSTENSSNGNGIIFVGIVSPESEMLEYRKLNKPAGDAIGHILATGPYKNDTIFTYYWGAGWSKGGMPDMETWNNYLENFERNLKSPLEVYVSK